ncbi:hypothetical protein SOASR030_35550 [Leminorella grimontii]|uniref:HTH cro/C1-type domain-containing protein n=1 Tax=Leminorella grimontii TaxID=82981 RepID=A0AAV5N952_9GAMM|nr:helix-turn-helix transcriptional regulator [Leminorella grimontii]KFC94394.1 DNA-binding repressor [Leminorella grimontii ATCC 33999 = DSM 5078]GKX57443.1 hypothetical protein SOASR030_35550 [Leminorella grimontii]VFS54608.1 Helix-turn-helix [Leminorella grimontii]
MEEKNKESKSSGYKEKTGDELINRNRIIVREGINRFGERLKKAMGGMSNSELGRKSGMSEATIRKYLQGKIYPGIDSAALIANACNVPLMWLVSGIELNDEKREVSSLLSELLGHLDEVDKQMLTNLLVKEGINTLLALLDKNNLLLLQQPDTLKAHMIQEYITGPLREEEATTASTTNKVCARANEEQTTPESLTNTRPRKAG